MSIDPSTSDAATSEAAAPAPGDGPFVIPEHLRADQLQDRMGIEFVTWTRDEVVGRMPVAGNRQPYGLLHGGASAVLAETLGSVLAGLNVLPERSPVGLELKLLPPPRRRRRLGDRYGAAGAPGPQHLDQRDRRPCSPTSRGRRTCTARLTCLHRDVPAG